LQEHLGFVLAVDLAEHHVGAAENDQQADAQREQAEADAENRIHPLERPTPYCVKKTDEPSG